MSPRGHQKIQGHANAAEMYKKNPGTKCSQVSLTLSVERLSCASLSLSLENWLHFLFFVMGNMVVTTSLTPCLIVQIPKERLTLKYPISDFPEQTLDFFFLPPVFSFL